MRIHAPALLAALMLASAPIFAAQRTFVSAGGADTNTTSKCSLALPCRTFGAALTVTDASGEIVVLDSGGYGSVTIDKSVTIVSPPGVYGGISVLPGADGIVVNGLFVFVTLKGLTINGQGGNAGIDFIEGSQLTVEQCEIANVGGSGTGGILAHAQGSVVVVRDTIIRDTAYFGIHVYTSGNPIALIAENVAVHNTSPWGIYVGGSAHTGNAEAYLTRVTVTGSNTRGVSADSSSGGTALVSITNSTVSFNFRGIYADGANAKMIVATSTLAGNVHEAMLQTGSSTVLSRGDNTVHDNNGGGAQSSGTIGSLAPM